MSATATKPLETENPPFAGLRDNPAGAPATDQEFISGLRRSLCLAMEDIGGVNTRLREIENGLTTGGELEEIATWLVEAAQTLTEAAIAATNHQLN